MRIEPTRIQLALCLAHSKRTKNNDNTFTKVDNFSQSDRVHFSWHVAGEYCKILRACNKLKDSLQLQAPLPQINVHKHHGGFCREKQI